MADIDIFVHPTFPIYNVHIGGPRTRISIDEYLEHLAKELKASSNPVLIRLPVDAPAIARAIEEASLFASLPSDRKVRSYTGNNPKAYYASSGYIASEDRKRFTGLLCNATTKSDVRVHGAYFGRCVRDLAFEVFAYLRYGIDVCRLEDKRNGRLLKDLLTFRFSEITGAVRRSGVKYGVVFSPGIISDEQNPESQLVKPRITKPFGNLHYQLIDERTVVYS